MIARYTSGSYADPTPLLHAGLDSLTLLRIAVDVVSDDDAEIDASGLVKLRTIRDLKDWLVFLSTVSAHAGSAHACNADAEATC